MNLETNSTQNAFFRIAFLFYCMTNKQVPKRLPCGTMVLSVKIGM